ncbi:unnamed protein product [Linum trigynum]|uniref:Uncharacterized protein n=1 Tax=Linum trigynum TaxID=586398 RepID=A0AAV2FQ08_9ROSI
MEGVEFSNSPNSQSTPPLINLEPEQQQPLIAGDAPAAAVNDGNVVTVASDAPVNDGEPSLLPFGAKRPLKRMFGLTLLGLLISLV